MNDKRQKTSYRWAGLYRGGGKEWVEGLLGKGPNHHGEERNRKSG